MYRAMFRGEAPWDLFVLLFISGGISISYMAQHKALAEGFFWKSAIIIVVTAIIAAAVAVVISLSKVM